MLLNCEILQSAGGDTYVIINGISFIQPSLEDALAFIASVAPAHELDLVEEWDLDQGPFDLTVA